jgi:hypothetical protein
MAFFTPFGTDEPGASANINYRLAEMEAAINARHGAMVERTQLTLPADAATITIDVTVGDNLLMLVTNLRTNRAAANDAVYMTINDDITSSYIVRYIFADTVGAPSAAGASSSNGFTLDYAATGASAPANTFASMMMRVPMASSSILKACTYDISQSDSAASFPRLVMGSAWYPAAAAVTRLKLVPVNGTLFVAGSSYTLYGYS